MVGTGCQGLEVIQGSQALIAPGYPTPLLQVAGAVTYPAKAASWQVDGELDEWQTRATHVRDNNFVTSNQRRALWGGTAALGVALLIVSVYLGLEKASMLGGIVGAFFGLLGIAIGIYQLRSTPGGSTGSPRQIQRSGNDSVNLQSGNDLTIGDSNTFGKSP